jgi:hypothetical protein
MIVDSFNSINEVKKLVESRVYHNNNKCASGRDIPKMERRAGTAGYRLCSHCKELNVQDRANRNS